MTWAQYLSLGSLALLWYSLTVFSWRNYQRDVAPINERIKQMDIEDKVFEQLMERKKRFNFRSFTMNKHKLNKTDKMKCPTCDHEHDDQAKDFVTTNEGWENGATDVCDSCDSEMYCYNDDGFVYVEEV